jgi:ABC-type glycerol-3-phosphate transport system permease component
MPGGMSPSRLRQGMAELLVLAALGVVWIFMLSPAGWIFYSSLQTNETLFSGKLAGFTLENYAKIFNSGFRVFLANSLAICTAAVLVSTFVSVLAAYVFSRKQFRFRRLLFSSVLSGQLFPWIILVTPLFILFSRMGLLNSYAGIIFCYAAISIPFSVYLLVGYLQSIPLSLDEAARIDGATQYQVIWKIIFPIMLPGIVATTTYAFLLCWSEYLLALAFLSDENMKTLPLGLYAFFGQDTADWGAIMAASALTTLPTLALFLPLQRRLASGLAAGAVKQ